MGNTRELNITGPDAEEAHEGVDEAEETRIPLEEFEDGVEPGFQLFPTGEMKGVEIPSEVEGMGEIEYTSRQVGASEGDHIQLVEEETSDQSKYKGKGTYRGLESFKIHQVYKSSSDDGYPDNAEEGSVYDAEEISIADEESSDLEEGIQVRAESPTYQREHQCSIKEPNFNDANRDGEIVSTFNFLLDQDLSVVRITTLGSALRSLPKRVDR